MYAVKDLFPNLRKKKPKQANKFRHAKKEYVCNECKDTYWATDYICQERKDLGLCVDCYKRIADKRRYYKKKGK